MTIKAGVTKHKLKVRDNVGQSFTGMNKAAGHAAYMHIGRDIPIAVKSFEIIEIYGLLCDYGTRKCEVYKLVRLFEE